MMDIPDDLCEHIYVFAKKTTSIIKAVYNSENVYLCTMSDGTTNHFHFQLIPGYANKKRGSKNFVKPRQEYKTNEETIKVLRLTLNNK